MELNSLFHIVNEADVDFYIHHARLEKFKIDLHSHQKGQLLYAEGGIVHVFINEKHWYLPARCYMWIPANSEHAIVSYSKNIKLYSFYFKVLPDDSEFYSETNIYFADDMLREMILYTRRWEGSVIKKKGSPYYFMQAIKSILPDLNTNKIPFSVQHPFPKDEKLIEIGSFLLANISKSYSIEEISKIFGISVRTLSRKFKDQMGLNYVRFLRSLRITKALELIATHKYNMLEVALMVGYSSVSSFSTIFLKIIGMRPTEYANLLRR